MLRKRLKMKSNIKVPIFIPHLGCGNDCVFCNQVKITGHKNKVDYTEIESIFSDYTSGMTDMSEVEIAFFGGSFTGLDIESQTEYLDIAKDIVIKNGLKGIRMSTRPDYIDKEVINRLKAYPITAIELGVQSMDTNVLRKSKRGHSVIDVYNAVKLIKDATFSLGLQMMFDLPGDTMEKSISTAEKLIKMKPDFVRLYPTLVLKDTELEKMYYSGEYDPWNEDYMINTVNEVYKLFLASDIDVIRVGLHSSDAMFIDSIVAGFYHPAMREVILSKMFLDSMIINVADGDIIEVNQRDISNIVGLNKRNKIELNDKGIYFKIKISDIEELHYKINGRVHCIYDITES